MLIPVRLWLSLAVVVAAVASYDEQYLDKYTVAVPEGDDVAELVARSHGLQLASKMENLRGMYVLERSSDPARRSRRSAVDIVSRLASDPNVRLAEQQRLLKREKRGYEQEPSLSRKKRYTVHNKAIELGISAEDYREMDRKREEESRLSGRDSSFTAPLPIDFNDPKFPKQWYLVNVGQNGGHVGNDLNVVPAWKAGYTGEGVTVLVLDDGVDHTNEDLQDNFNGDISADFNSGIRNDKDPMPDTSNSDNSHGTRCAGEIAGAANNSFCGVGVAFKSSIGGIRILDGSVTDELEARALTHKMDIVDIYSASWGPPDDGTVMEGPGALTRQALRVAAEEGRGGKGAVFAWATGNGRSRNDTCSCDGYVGSIYTISIGSITEEGASSYFTEICPSTMAVVPTGGTEAPGASSSSPVQVVTTDINNGCIESFQGTSAAAPLAAGCFALVLQANPDLTYRDLNYLLVKTSRITHNQEGYISNGAGHMYNPMFGFGAMDCSGMVNRSIGWTNVSPLLNESYDGDVSSVHISPGSCKEFEIQVETPSIRRLEHVDLHIMVDTARRGDLTINLVSPSGTSSRMLEYRFGDIKPQIDFTFNTVLNWGENPSGVWTMKLCSVTEETSAELQHWGMTIYGIADTDEPNLKAGDKRSPTEPSHPMTEDEVEDAIEDQEERESDLTLQPSEREDLEMSEREINEAMAILEEMARQLREERQEKYTRGSGYQRSRDNNNFRNRYFN